MPWQEVRREGEGWRASGVPGGSGAGAPREARPTEREEELSQVGTRRRDAWMGRDRGGQ